MQQGTIESWHTDRASGFIRQDEDDAPDLFFHIRACRSLPFGVKPRVGMRVGFTIETDGSGRLRAADVTLLT